MERRNFLRFGAASAAGLASGAASLYAWRPRAHAATFNHSFEITEGVIAQGDGVEIYFHGFSSDGDSLNVPGQSLVVQQGDTVIIEVTNNLNDSHSFTIDGISDSTVDTRIRPGRTEVIEFVADNWGTYMYYDRLNAPYNRVVGLHGAIAVMPDGSDNELYPGSPTFVQQKFWIFNETDPAWNEAISNGDTPNNDFVPRYFTINGLSGRPPNAPGNGDQSVDSMHNYDTALYGSVGDRTLIRMLNAGMAKHSMHVHANHVEWLTQDGEIRPIWLKDVIPMSAGGGICDVIYPFEPPPDAWPPTNVGQFPMHLHDEMTQTAGGGLYLFGALTDIFFE